MKRVGSGRILLFLVLLMVKFKRVMATPAPLRQMYVQNTTLRNRFDCSVFVLITDRRNHNFIGYENYNFGPHFLDRRMKF